MIFQIMEENESKNKNMNNYDEHYLNGISFDRENGSKKKRRNRSSSVDDRKYKEDNVKCQCFIF